jgi:hypothetical protein
LSEQEQPAAQTVCRVVLHIVASWVRNQTDEVISSPAGSARQLGLRLSGCSLPFPRACHKKIVVPLRETRTGLFEGGGALKDGRRIPWPVEPNQTY